MISVTPIEMGWLYCPETLIKSKRREASQLRCPQDPEAHGTVRTLVLPAPGNDETRQSQRKRTVVSHLFS